MRRVRIYVKPPCRVCPHRQPCTPVFSAMPSRFYYGIQPDGNAHPISLTRILMYHTAQLSSSDSVVPDLYSFRLLPLRTVKILTMGHAVPGRSDAALDTPQLVLVEYKIWRSCIRLFTSSPRAPMDTKANLDWDQESRPPAYSVGDDHQPPKYSPPTSFVIGTKTLAEPLVHVNELKTHLALLRAFKVLRTTVEESKATEWPELVQPLDPQQRWAWFVGLAVDRYVSFLGEYMLVICYMLNRRDI